MGVTHDQQIAKLKAEIERLKGEIAGLKYAVAVHPYPIQYVPAPVYPRPVYQGYPGYPPVTYSADACTQKFSPLQVRIQQAQVMN